MKPKLAYAISGEGKGHAARAIALYPELNQFYDIIFYCPENIHSYLRQWLGEIEIRPVTGWFFTMEEGRILHLKTLRANAGNILRKKRRIDPICRHFKSDGIQGLLNDYEPFSLLAASRMGIPSLSMTHPGVVNTHPGISKAWIVARLVSTQMMPWANRYLICSFYNGDIGPIIRQEIRDAIPHDGDHILIQTKPDSKETLLRALRQNSGEPLDIFPDSPKNFAYSLATSKAVIAPAGHQLICEAMHLGKPILVFPIAGHYEQELNARMLESCGRGMRGDINNPGESIRQFLDRLDRFPAVQSGKQRFELQDDTPQALFLIRRFMDLHIRGGRPAPLRYPLNRFTSGRGKGFRAS